MDGTFTIGETDYRYSKLKSAKSLEGFSLVMGVIDPAIGAIVQLNAGAFDLDLAKYSRKLPGLLALFVRNLEAHKEGLGTDGTWLPFEKMREQALAGPHETVALIAQCISLEYGGFLAEKGKLFQSMLPTPLTGWISQIGSTSESGDSQPADSGLTDTPTSQSDGP